MNSAYRLLRAILIVLWPPAVLAAGAVTLDTTLSEIHFNVWIIVWVLSTMGGMTSLLHRLKTEVPPGLLMYVVAHMLMAWFAGAASFFLLEAAGSHDLIEVPLIGIAAYSGARLVDNISEKFAGWVEKCLERLFGSENPK